MQKDDSLWGQSTLIKHNRIDGNQQFSFNSTQTRVVQQHLHCCNVHRRSSHENEDAPPCEEAKKWDWVHHKHGPKAKQGANQYFHCHVPESLLCPCPLTCTFPNQRTVSLRSHDATNKIPAQCSIQTNPFNPSLLPPHAVHLRSNTQPPRGVPSMPATTMMPPNIKSALPCVNVQKFSCT